MITDELIRALCGMDDASDVSIEWEIKDVTRQKSKARRMKATGRKRVIISGRPGRWHKRLCISRIGGQP